MTQTEKIQGWILQFGEQAQLAAARWVKAADKLAAGTYKPEDAYSDLYFYMSQWLVVLPDPATGIPAIELPQVLIAVHAGEADAVGCARIRTVAGATIVGDLQEVGDPARTIPGVDITPQLFDGGNSLMITATNLVARNLATGEEYWGAVEYAGVQIARVHLKVI